MADLMSEKLRNRKVTRLAGHRTVRRVEQAPLMSSSIQKGTTMINLDNVTTIPSDAVELFAPVPEPVKLTPTMVCEIFKARKGTHRYDALACLARNLNKPVSRAKLIAAVYGKEADEKAFIGALGMCLEGGRKSIVKFNLPFRIVKENATITLVALN